MSAPFLTAEQLDHIAQNLFRYCTDNARDDWDTLADEEKQDWRERALAKFGDYASMGRPERQRENLATLGISLASARAPGTQCDPDHPNVFVTTDSIAAAPRREDAAGSVPEPFTSPAFWICPVCAMGAAERVELCEGYVDIADPEEGETEDTDARHEVVYRPEYVHRLLAALSTAEREKGANTLSADDLKWRSRIDALREFFRDSAYAAEQELQRRGAPSENHFVRQQHSYLAWLDELRDIFFARVPSGGEEGR